MRLVGVEETSPDWAIRVEINPKGNIATVTAYQKKLLHASTSINQQNEDTTLHNEKVVIKQNERSTQNQYTSSFG